MMKGNLAMKFTTEKKITRKAQVPRQSIIKNINWYFVLYKLIQLIGAAIGMTGIVLFIGAMDDYAFFGTTTLEFIRNLLCGAVIAVAGFKVFQLAELVPEE